MTFYALIIFIFVSFILAWIIIWLQEQIREHDEQVEYDRRIKEQCESIKAAKRVYKKNTKKVGRKA